MLGKLKEGGGFECRCDYHIYKMILFQGLSAIFRTGLPVVCLAGRMSPENGIRPISKEYFLNLFVSQTGQRVTGQGAKLANLNR